jgi:hypothetical protein
MAGWTFTALGIISGVVVYVSRVNIETIQSAPRSVRPQNSVSRQDEDAKTAVSVLVISIGGEESDTYASQIVAALGDQFHCDRFQIGSLANSSRG